MGEAEVVPLTSSLDRSGRPNPVGVALIVDADSYARSSMRRLLEGWDINVYEAGTAKLALVCASRFPLTCAVIEHVLTDAEGVEVGGRIALLRPEVRIAFVTTSFYAPAFRETGDELKGQAAAVTFFEKPLTPGAASQLRAFLLDPLPGCENPPP